MPSQTPDAKVIVEKPDMETVCPASGKKLKLKDLIEVGGKGQCRWGEAAGAGGRGWQLCEGVTVGVGSGVRYTCREQASCGMGFAALPCSQSKDPVSEEQCHTIDCLTDCLLVPLPGWRRARHCQGRGARFSAPACCTWTCPCCAFIACCLRLHFGPFTASVQSGRLLCKNALQTVTRSILTLLPHGRCNPRR